MKFPLISEYIEAIRLAEDNFDKLKDLRPVCGVDGAPMMKNGTSSVVFKMTDGTKMYAVKCFTKEQDGRDEAYRMIIEELRIVQSSYIVPIRYLPNELFVGGNCGTTDKLPVVVMDWVEGLSLDVYIRCHIYDRYLMRFLTYRFCRMAMWILSQPFAHGDINPDNIIVCDDGSLVFVDYDGMFVPSMSGMKKREVASPNYRHPSQTESDFNEHTDDFAISVLALSLKVLSLEPSLLSQLSSDALLFSASDYKNLKESQVISSVHRLLYNVELEKLYALFLLACSQKELPATTFHLFNLERPTKKEFEAFSTQVSCEERKEAVKDEFGVLYSKDGKRLLEAFSGLSGKYKVKDETKIICDNAFCIDGYGCGIKEIHIPNSVAYIGDHAFAFCRNLQNIYISNNVKSIGNSAFCLCDSLCEICIPDSVTFIGMNAFADCKSLQWVIVPENVISIGERTFESCTALQSIVIPDGVASIGNYAFYGCQSLQRIRIPNSVVNIGDHAFEECISLQNLQIFDGATNLGDWSFAFCESLCEVYIPNSVTSIGKHTFEGCIILQKIHLSDSLTSIEDFSFYGCQSLQAITIPNNVVSVGESSFYGCQSLQYVIIPNSVDSIGEYAFFGCDSLRKVYISNSVSNIGDEVFSYCDSLQAICVPIGAKDIFKVLLPSELHSKIQEISIDDF